MTLIILGRDGVINERRDRPISKPDDCVPIPRSLDAIARLCHAGHRIVVAANNIGLESGTVDADSLNRIHAKLQLCVVTAGGHLDAMFFSPEPDVSLSGSDLKSRLLNEIASRLQLDLTHIPAIGDTLDQVRAAREAGATPVLLRTSDGAAIDHEADLTGVAIFDDLSSFVERFLSDNSDVGQ